MRILFISVEVAPFAKVGGLADVAGALPKALRRLGHDARVVMPLYRMIEEDPRWTLIDTLDQFEVEMNPHWSKSACFKETELDGLPIGFIGTDEWFTEGVDNQSIYQPGGTQHLFFSQAVITAMEELDWIPDVIHCNDWHTGFLPVLMREKASPVWSRVASVYTIHNLAYQGEFGIDILDEVGLPRSLFNVDQVEAFGKVNFLKSGCIYADQVNTVSQNYALEIQTPEFGCSLDGLMTHMALEGRLSGILNGIDVDAFNPESDRDLPAPFSVNNLAGKSVCRERLLEELGLPKIEGAPLLGAVCRLNSQKGMDLLLNAAESLFALPVQLVIQGQGDRGLADAFTALEARFPRNFRYVSDFAPAVAQRIYGGCDAFLMPSAFEPCGLGQMIAMRYGTVPIVRSTGGLADTVFEGHNGFCFTERTPAALIETVQRARAAFNHSEHWRKLVTNGMSGEFGWENSAEDYIRLYAKARLARELVGAKTA